MALMSSPVEANTSSTFELEKGSGDDSSTVMCKTLPGAGELYDIQKYGGNTTLQHSFI